MSLPNTQEWSHVVSTLHETAQIVSVVRRASIFPQPNHLHHSLSLLQGTLTTGNMDENGELRLNLSQQSLEYYRGDTHRFSLDLDGYNQSTLFDGLFSKLTENDYYVVLMKPDVQETPFVRDTAAASRFGHVLQEMFVSLAVAKAYFYGAQSPIVMWSHGFDLSSIWFKGESNEEDPHINIGFSPGTPDVGEPYIYAYAYPFHEKLQSKIPARCEWHTGWSTPGIILRYSHFANDTDHRAVIVDALCEFYRTASRLLR